jgi:DNA-binding CsgD family transcriptional regulator
MLASFARDHGALFRSAYFNEWMRPQRMRHTLGSTMLAERGVIANVTLLRPPDMPTFADAEVSAFTRISAHMTRALRIAIRLEDVESGTPLDALSHGIAVIDGEGRLVGTNARMDALLAAGHGLARHDGRLVATRRPLCDQLQAATTAALRGLRTPLVAFTGRRGSGVQLALGVQSASARAGGHYLPSSPRVLVTVTESGRRPAVSADRLQHLYGLTRAEAGLAALVVEGRSLPDAARARGISHGTARGYLKTIFGKTGVHSQSALAARVLTDLAGTH